MADRGAGERMLHKLHQHKPTGSQVVGLITVLVVGGAVLAVGGMAAAACVTALVVLSPVLLLLSPVLVPAGVVALVCAGGAAMAVAAGLGLSWLYRYVKGHHPPGAEHMDAARARFHHTAHHVREKARDFTNSVAGAAPGA